MPRQVDNEGLNSIDFGAEEKPKNNELQKLGK